MICAYSLRWLHAQWYFQQHYLLSASACRHKSNLLKNQQKNFFTPIVPRSHLDIVLPSLLSNSARLLCITTGTKPQIRRERNTNGRHKTVFRTICVTPYEVATFLQVPERTFYRFVETGIIPEAGDREHIMRGYPVNGLLLSGLAH